MMNFKNLEKIPITSLKTLSAPLHYLSRAKLWLQVLVGMILGIAVGIMLSRDTGWVEPSTGLTLGEWLGLPGQIFLALIQMIVVPLVLASIVRGIAAATDVQQLKSTGTWLMVYFLLTTIIAIIIGISVGLFVKPGSYIDASSLLTQEQAQAQATLVAEAEALQAEQELTLQSVPGRLTDLLPKNPISAVVEGEMLQIVIFAVIIGIGLLMLAPASAGPLLDLFGSIQEVCMAIVGIAMRFAPLAVFGLLAQAMIRTGPEVLLGLGVYSSVVVGAMGILLVVYFLLAKVLGGVGFKSFFYALREPFLLGFSTNSSAATMPVTVKSAEDSLKVKPSIAQFVVPLGATVNMGGTALYQGLATIFMAQMFQIELGTGALVALVATALGASIGTPAVPGVGIIVLSSVLSSAGVPLSGLALIVGVDRILERFRTSLNVTGDLTACSVMDRWVGRK